MNIKEILPTIKNRLKSISNSPRLDAELLVTSVTGITKTSLIAYPEKELTVSETKALEKLVRRREQGEPMAYILGHKEFWSLDLMVTPDVLIPRPETELLVDYVLSHLPQNENCCVADLGSGSGAIAIALAVERPNWVIHATDQSEKALMVAKKNAKKYNVNNIIFSKGSWCDALTYNAFDAIVSNPPYISSNDPHLLALQFEPITALASGTDGLDDIRVIAAQAKLYLKLNGFIAIEHGYDQSEKILSILSEHYTTTQDHLDLALSPRFATAYNSMGYT